jgi:hypothetical protein
MDDNNFSDGAKNYVERFCRLTDGASAEDYTLFQFLQISNQHYFYKLYQPKLPNDRGLIKKWEKELRKQGVNILFNYEVIKLDEKIDDFINYVLIRNKVNNEEIKIESKNFILTIPPRPLLKLLENNFFDTELH